MKESGMYIQSLSNEELLSYLIPQKFVRKRYRGQLAPLIHGTSTEEPIEILLIALELVKRLLKEDLKKGPELTSPGATKNYLVTHFFGMKREAFVVIYMDNRHRVIDVIEMFRGTVDSAAVYPREIVACALRLNAAACIFAHNHPSGVAEPSHADNALTRRLRDALALVEVRVLDHFVIGDSELVSFAERGLL
jgi:DNA repair protein RadC